MVDLVGGFIGCLNDVVVAVLGLDVVVASGLRGAVMM